MSDGKDRIHLSIVICGHVDAGKSTTTGRLLFELGGISERDMEKLKDEANKLGKGSFAFAFFMDRQKDERERGVTISCTTMEFFTDRYHYTIIDAPGHRDFIKNMITGASQADVAVLMVPADGNFTASVAKGNHKTGDVQGQTRQHARLINLLGCKQLVVCVNKMDCDLAKYGEERFKEVANEVKDILCKVGWKKAFVKDSVPFIPISGWVGDNLLKPSENMKWYTGKDIKVGKDKIKVHTFLDAVNNMVQPPDRSTNGSLRMPVSGVYRIKGVGNVITGRVEQGKCAKDAEVCFVPTHTPANPCKGKVFSVEMHHKTVESACPGDNVGLNVKGLEKLNMPKVGDVMVEIKDTALQKPVDTFTAQVQILDHPGELKIGYTPIAYCRTGRAPVRLSKIDWKIGKSTGGQKVEDPPFIKRNEMAQVQFSPAQPFVVDSFKNCEGLGRIAIMEGNDVVMVGKVAAVKYGQHKGKK